MWIDMYNGWPFDLDDDEGPSMLTTIKELNHDCMFHYSKVVEACIKCEPEKDPRNRTDLWGVK